MRIVVSGRGTGKTTLLIRWLLEQPTNRFIIVSSVQRKNHIILEYSNSFSIFRNFKIENYIIVVNDWYRFKGLGSVEYAIDDLEDIISTIFNLNISLVTMNGISINLSELYGNQIQI